MTAVRVYKVGMPHEAAREELFRCAGTQFDHAVVLAFVSVLKQHDAPIAAA
jgi:HD-GYP domain-containing protein (c-di-GMP phosphodiesterase class II)